MRYVRNRGFLAYRYRKSKFSKNNDHKKLVRFVYNDMPQDQNPKFDYFSIQLLPKVYLIVFHDTCAKMEHAFIAKMAGRSFLVNSDPLPPPIRFFYKENVNFYSGCSFSSDPPRLRANLLFKWSIRRHIPYPYHFHPLPLEFSWGVWPLNFSDFAPKCHPMCPHSYPVCRSLHNIQFQILRHGFLKSFR